MLDIREKGNDYIALVGRFEATSLERARDVLDRVAAACTIDFAALEYISSAGLGLLLGTQQRLRKGGCGLKLINMNAHIRELFHTAGFDRVFEID